VKINTNDIKAPEEIVHIWSRRLEFVIPILARVFQSKSIPESLLPFPKETLLKALGTMESHHERNGNIRGA
jgi:hypothetical protein